MPTENQTHSPSTNSHPTPGAHPTEIGYAVDVRDYMVMVNGLPNVRINEIVTTEQGARGLVYALKSDMVEVMMLDDVKIRPQQTFIRSNQPLTVVSGQYLLGRAINPLGIPVDGKGMITKVAENKRIDTKSPGIKFREFIKEQFKTGVTAVDMLVPLAMGQRELIIGDARSGKTSFLIDVIVNVSRQRPVVSSQSPENLKSDSELKMNGLKSGGSIVVYAMIGKPIVEIKRLIDALTANNVLKNTVIVAASSSEKSPLIYLGPSVAVTVAESFQQKGFNVLLVLDDLGLHAKYYREISLLSGKAPGRQSYPGDIFYQHARLLERAGKFNSQAGGGSITALPIIETNLDDTTGFIQTNLMGMTDGHILFDSKVYHQGQRPAIDVSLSVSRVGRQTQLMVQKQLSDKIKMTLSQSTKLETLSRFGSDLSADTKALLNSGKQIKFLLKQSPLVNLSIPVQMALTGLVFMPFLKSKDLGFVTINKQKIIETLINMNLESDYDAIQKMTDLDQYMEYLKKVDGELSVKLKV